MIHPLDPSSGCHQLRDDLSAWLVGDLEPARQGQLQQHAARCEGCAQEMAEWRELLGELASLPYQSRPARAWSGIDAELSREYRRVGVMRRARRVEALLLALAASSLVAVLWWGSAPALALAQEWLPATWSATLGRLPVRMTPLFLPLVFAVAMGLTSLAAAPILMLASAAPGGLPRTGRPA